jgi:hypothetical protein
LRTCVFEILVLFLPKIVKNLNPKNVWKRLRKIPQKMDGKKIAFSFGSKQVKKPLLAPLANSFERKKVEAKKELIGSIEGDSFDVLK